MLCPECRENIFTILEHIKNQKQIANLQSYCSMKERGCDWSGTLEQLDTHLDPDQDNCQYVDTKCPLNCHMTIPKNKVEQHVAQHCAKRPYVCQYCSFKATYEEVVDKHLPECKYVPLQCPNLCGVTFERDFMEDHMKMCCLEEIGCEFSGVGCDGRFIREDQEEHTRQNSQNHLTLTASLAVETKEQLQQKLLEQDKKHKEEEEKLNGKVEEQDKKLKEQDRNLQMQQQKLQAQEDQLQDQGERLIEQERKLEECQAKLKQHEIQLGQKATALEQIHDFICLKRTFEMNNFRQEKAKDEPLDWKAPACYTHIGGYRFCIGVDANGCGKGRGKAICVYMWCVSGEFDDHLDWVSKVKFTIELVSQRGSKNVTCNVMPHGASHGKRMSGCLTLAALLVPYIITSWNIINSKIS